MNIEKERKKELKTINRLRREMGMPELKDAIKGCLRCGKPFASHGKHNRICNDCRYANEDSTEIIYELGGR